MIQLNGVKFYKVKNAMIQDYYYISKKGDILSTFWNEPRVLSQRKDKDGYMDVSLVKKNGNRSPMRVHRLVALTFIENPNNYPVVNHKNGIPHDNRLENLEWCSISYNTKHGYDELGVICARQKVVKSTHVDTGRRLVFSSMGACAEHYGVDTSMISRRISGETSNPSGNGILKGIYFKDLGYANVTTIETTA